MSARQQQQSMEHCKKEYGECLAAAAKHGTLQEAAQQVTQVLLPRGRPQGAVRCWRPRSAAPEPAPRFPAPPWRWWA